MRFPVLPSSFDAVLPVRWIHSGPQSLRRRLLGFSIAAVGVFLCSYQALSLRGDLYVADGISYFFYFLSLTLCAIACLPFAIRESGSLRLRWIFFAIANLTRALNFFFAAAQHVHFTDSITGQFHGAWNSALGNSLVLVAVTLAFSGASRPMTVLDTLQAVLFGVTNFLLIFNPHRWDFFTENHLLTATVISTFLFLAALLASFGADSRNEVRFLHLLTLFLGLHVIAVVCMNQIAYDIAHEYSGTIWDLPETLFNCTFLYLAFRAYDQPAPRLREKRPTIFIRNLMPSLLTLGNIALALILLSTYRTAAITILIFAFLCYAMRTTMLQSQTGHAHASLHAINQELETLATRDSLTGAGNRRSLVAALNGLADSPYQDFALLLVDTDNFKQANDNRGHLYGDQVLITIAGVLRTVSAGIPDTHCARFGGDEFALLLPGHDTVATAAVAESLRLSVEQLLLDAGDRTITISLGGTVCALDADLTFEQLLSRADDALYRAKSLGRNRVEMSA